MSIDKTLAKTIIEMSKYDDEHIEWFYKYSIGFSPCEIAILNSKRTSSIREAMKTFAEDAHVAMRSLRPTLKRVFKELGFHGIPRTKWREQLNKVLDEIDDVQDLY